MNYSSVVVSVLSLIVAGAPGQAQTPPASRPTTVPSSQPAAPTPADIAFGPISRELKGIHQTMNGKTEVDPKDKPSLLALRDKAAAFSTQFPADPRGPAAEIMLSTWLKDDASIDHTFQRLVKAGRNDGNIVLSYVNRLKGRNRYAEALDVLRAQTEIDWAKFPRLVMAYTECLFAEEHFAEALEMLNQIPSEVLANDTGLSSAVSQTRQALSRFKGYWIAEQKLRSEEQLADDLPRVLIVTSRGSIVAELFENQAPNTVANFISLTEKGFYDGTRFHEVAQNVAAKGGDPGSRGPNATGLGTGNPGYMIPDEIATPDSRKHFTGTLTMINQKFSDTGGCVFGITFLAVPEYNGSQTAFGRVVQGIDVVRSLEAGDVIQSVVVLRKRNHPYSPNTLPVKIVTVIPGTGLLGPDGTPDASILPGSTPTTAPAPGDAKPEIVAP